MTQVESLQAEANIEPGYMEGSGFQMNLINARHAGRSSFR